MMKKEKEILLCIEYLLVKFNDQNYFGKISHALKFKDGDTTCQFRYLVNAKLQLFSAAFIINDGAIFLSFFGCCQ
jgi:hypothetical protein